MDLPHFTALNIPTVAAQFLQQLTCNLQKTNDNEGCMFYFVQVPN